MRRILLGLSALALLGGLGSASVANDAPWVPVKTLELTSDGSLSHATRTVANDSRYRWHNGRWWYYMPNNSWVVWSGGRWSPWTGAAYGGYRDNYYRGNRYYNDRYYNDRYYRDGYRNSYRYGYRGPYNDNYRGRAPYVSGYRGFNGYNPGLGRSPGRRW